MFLVFQKCIRLSLDFPGLLAMCLDAKVFSGKSLQVKLFLQVILRKCNWLGHSTFTKNKYLFLVESLREKCPSMELFLVRIFLYLSRIQENTDQK